MGPFNRLVGSDAIPPHKKAIALLSPLTGIVVPLNDVPHSLFTSRLFGEGVAIKPSGYQVLAPFAGTVMHFPELANQIRIKAQNGLQLQIQLGIDSHIMMAEGFKRFLKKGDTFKQGQVLAEFSLNKMKAALPSILCPVTLLNSDKVKAVQGHYYHVIANEDKILSIYL